MERNCLGSPGPARRPAPAATMTTPTSGGETTGELTDAFQPHDVQTRWSDARAGGAEHPAESLARRLDEPALDAGHGPDLAPQARSEEHTSELQSPCNLV